MRRIALIICVLAASAASLATVAGADESQEYTIEMYNAFGIVEGSEVKVAGVTAGTVSSLDINERKRAVLTVELTGPLSQLGEDTTCSSEPQSLIAEYFIDCQPKGEPITEPGTASEPAITADKVRLTVQPDLVQSTLRLPFAQRLRIIINEFGTALAGNPDELNEAIRLGAPALTNLNKALKILADQNTVIRDLNVDSDRIIARLNERKEDISRFIKTAGDTATASAAVRDDLSTNFDLLDDFLTELRPTMAELEVLAREQTPLLVDLRGAAPGLNTLAQNLPAFNRASERSLVTLGRASTVGRTALRRGADEIKALRESAKGSFRTGELLADFLRDLDDPRRAVEVDDRAARDTGRAKPTGYTGFEGLLNYVYYQPLALNQYDEVGHTLHFSLFDIENSACATFNAAAEVPAEAGGTTKDATDAAQCVSWLGDKQPGINEDLDVPAYDESVCPQGEAEPPPGEPRTCGPGAGTTSAQLTQPQSARASERGGGSASADLLDPGGVPGDPGQVRDQLEDLLDLPPAEGVKGVRDGLKGVGGRGGAGGDRAEMNQAAEDLLDFLFTS